MPLGNLTKHANVGSGRRLTDRLRTHCECQCASHARLTPVPALNGRASARYDSLADAHSKVLNSQMLCRSPMARSRHRRNAGHNERCSVGLAMVPTTVPEIVRPGFQNRHGAFSREHGTHTSPGTAEKGRATVRRSGSAEQGSARSGAIVARLSRGDRFSHWGTDGVAACAGNDDLIS